MVPYWTGERLGSMHHQWRKEFQHSMLVDVGVLYLLGCPSRCFRIWEIMKCICRSEIKYVFYPSIASLLSKESQCASLDPCQDSQSGQHQYTSVVTLTYALKEMKAFLRGRSLRWLLCQELPWLWLIARNCFCTSFFFPSAVSSSHWHSLRRQRTSS
jgi:hypothetical protein